MQVNISGACLNETTCIVVDGVGFYRVCADDGNNVAIIIYGSCGEADAGLTLNRDTGVDCDAVGCRGGRCDAAAD